jgi:diadenosine tetraphosphate (Ap4A) HIT family hydrolase
MDGHMLVVPRKHIGTIYELTMPEQKAVWALVAEARGRLLTGLMPDSFDISFDHGVHAVVHLVPPPEG